MIKKNEVNKNVYVLAVDFWANSTIGLLKSAKTWEERKDILVNMGHKVYFQGKEDMRKEFRDMLEVKKDEE